MATRVQETPNTERLTSPMRSTGAQGNKAHKHSSRLKPEIGAISLTDLGVDFVLRGSESANEMEVSYSKAKLSNEFLDHIR
jgi:hypothetical protein